jgi:hypothetical protein
LRFSSSLVSCATAQTLRRQTDKMRREVTRTLGRREMVLAGLAENDE